MCSNRAEFVCVAQNSPSGQGDAVGELVDDIVVAVAVVVVVVVVVDDVVADGALVSVAFDDIVGCVGQF